MNLLADAEKKNDLVVLVKSNALRAKSREKRKEMEMEKGGIDRLQKKLKTL